MPGRTPGMISVGNSGAGGGVDLGRDSLRKGRGVQFNHIPFSGGGPSVTALLGGHVNAVSVSPPEGISQVQAGKLRIIALFSEKGCDLLFPNIPTCKEQGMNFAMGQWRGLGAPKGTPAEVIQKFHEAFKKGMADAGFMKNAKDMAVNLEYMAPSELGKVIAKDHEFYGKLVTGDQEVTGVLPAKEKEERRERR